jgi:SpoIID/LytB domain protein
MIDKEPILRVGIIDGRTRIEGEFIGAFVVGDTSIVEGEFSALVQDQLVVLSDRRQRVIARGDTIVCKQQSNSTFRLREVTIGSGFHWQQNRDQVFNGSLTFVARENGTLAAVNDISLERYLTSVISSEMNAGAPREFLKAHAITSRSWLIAMLDRKAERRPTGARTLQNENELIRWYDREDHDLYDVCADDHCQRYQGITGITDPVRDAVEETRGECLLHGNQVCDARFSKCCGGLTEQFETCWEDVHVPYLQSVSDSIQEHSAIKDESNANEWIRSSPEAYCSTADMSLLSQILPSFDRETRDFFRWKVVYRREELEDLLRERSGFDFGTLQNLHPVERGPSGRILKLKVEGSRKSFTVGKELEIRRWLSKSHLYSSAFVVETEPAGARVPERFILYGSGWGHGVGLCQIGAAVMATKGFNAGQILKHYFRGTTLKKLY